MGIEEYLTAIDDDQFVPGYYWSDMEDLSHELREMICNIKEISTVPIAYDAGSKKKGTMIKDAFDLDIVFYYPNHTKESLEEISTILESALRTKYSTVYTKNVSIRIDFPYRNDLAAHNFHVDVVPARKLRSSEDYVWIYRWQEGNVIKSNVSKHLEAVFSFRRPDILRLLKLWRVRNNCICPGFILERITIETIQRIPYYWRMKKYDLLIEMFQYICKQFPNRKFIADPADKKRNLIDDNEISAEEKESLIQSAEYALAQNLNTIPGWREIYTRGLNFRA